MKRLYMFFVYFCLLFWTVFSQEILTLPIYSVTIEQDNKCEGVEISVVPMIEQSIIPGFLCFNVNIKNNSGKIVKIDWEQSSFFFNSTSNVPFISGQKYSDATKTSPPSIIPNSEETSIDVFSSGNVFYKSKWYILPIFEEKISLVLCIQNGNNQYYYTIKASMEDNKGISKMYLDNKEKGEDYMKHLFATIKEI